MSHATPWGGRFSQEPAEALLRFTESTGQDAALFVDDVRGSIAHARMLAARGLISEDDARAIVQGLEGILADWQAGRIQLDPRLEDVHMNVERLLEQRIGEPARRLHTARSRNDQVALDLRLFLRRRTADVRRALARLAVVLCDLAEQHAETVMPGYTHLQRAQAVTLGHHLLAYVEMLARDDQRFADAARRMGQSPLGAGALAGTSLPIDREQTAAELGFEGVAANSLDAVADRDFAVEFLAAAAILMMHLSRLGEELVLWSTQEFGFMTFSDAYATGSSMMPQKKNPDIAELVRGRAGRVYGDLVALLVVLKGLPLSYNRDLQEDKPPVIDAADTCEACLSILADALSQAQFHADRMAAAAADPALGATDLAEYLVERGVPFREAHHVVGRLVAETDGLKRVDAAALARAHQAFGPDALERLDPRRAVQARSLPGGPAPERVRRRAAQLRELFRAAGG
ncbi:MAG: argininosuccinate lyase [Thermaerobacter sp.]|nr:argininosuccinate lyase [Bacillota bacterium]REJ37898.1 MAG: argininosuccinate lyase [Bacillota bacterium]